MARASDTVTHREAEVLAALGKRLTNAEIASQLYLSERTVESHVSSLLRKLGATNRLELAEIAVAQGPPTPPLPAALELLADPAGYCGRTEELRRLRALWRRAREGVMLMGLVTGEAGIGKSRLVAEIAAEVHEADGRVLFGANVEHVERPFEPFLQALAADAETLSDAELLTRAGASAEPLGRAVPELADRLGVATNTVVFDPISARTDAFAGFHAYLHRAAATAPTLLVVDDVHWATNTTLGALHYLATVGGNVPLLTLVTSRDAAPEIHEDLVRFFSDLTRVPSVERVALRGLDTDEVAALLDVLGADADPSATVRDTGGNPLFVREVATGAAAGSLPSLLARRYARLDASATAMLDLAAAIGAEFDADLVAASAGMALLPVLEGLEAAESAGLIVATPGRPGRFAFAHALFRAAHYDALAESRRLTLHRQIAHALEPRSGDDRVIPELARHACRAAPLGDVRRALAHATRAAALAEQALAFDEAAHHYRRALHVVDLLDPPDPRARLAVSIRLGEVMQGGGQPGYETVLVEAARSARELGDAQALAEAGWAMVKYGGPRHPSRDAEFVAIAQEALRELGPAPTAARARTLAAASEDLCFTDPTQASVLAHEALAIARRLDDKVTLGHVLLSYRVSACTPGNAQARHPTADELVDIGRQTGQPTFTMLGLYHRAFSYRAEGNLEAANMAIDAAVALRGERALPPTYVAAVTLFQATRRLLVGELDEAEEIANQVWALASDGFAPANWYGPGVLMVRHAQDRLTEMLPLIEGAVEQPGIGEIYRAALAVALAHAGRGDDAATIVRTAAGNGFSDVPRNFSWLASLLAFAEAAELIGDRNAAGRIFDLLTPYEGMLGDMPQTVVAPVDLALAQSALTAGAVSVADAAAVRAIAASRRRGTPVYLGRELVRLAAARRLAGAAAGDVDEIVGEARVIAAQTGASLIERELRFYDL